MLSIAAMVVAWFGGRHKDIETRFQAHGARVDQLDRAHRPISQQLLAATLAPNSGQEKLSAGS